MCCRIVTWTFTWRTAAHSYRSLGWWRSARPQGWSWPTGWWERLCMTAWSPTSTSAGTAGCPGGRLVGGGVQIPGVGTKREAPGLILAHGVVGETLYDGMITNVYISRDGGMSWRQVSRGQGTDPWGGDEARGPRADPGSWGGGGDTVWRHDHQRLHQQGRWDVLETG